MEQASCDLPLGVRDELLADSVRAVAAPEARGSARWSASRTRSAPRPTTAAGSRRWPRASSIRFRGATEGEPDAPESEEAPAAEVAALPIDAGPARRGCDHDAELEADAAMVGRAVRRL